MNTAIPTATNDTDTMWLRSAAGNTKDAIEQRMLQGPMLSEIDARISAGLSARDKMVLILAARETKTTVNFPVMHHLLKTEPALGELIGANEETTLRTFQSWFNTASRRLSLACNAAK